MDAGRALCRRGFSGDVGEGGARGTDDARYGPPRLLSDVTTGSGSRVHSLGSAGRRQRAMLQSTTRAVRCTVLTWCLGDRGLQYADQGEGVLGPE